MKNNNMKVSFNLRNYIYDIKSNLTTTIDQREIEPKDVIRIMHNQSSGWGDDVNQKF